MGSKTFLPPQSKPVASAPLRVGRADDAHEADADRMAAQATRSLATGTRAGAPVQPFAAAPRLLQRAPLAEAREREREREDEETDRPGAAPGGLVVEDTARTMAGQMHKSELLEQLRRASCEAADAELRKVGRDTEGCPFVERVFASYRRRSAAQLERALRRYAPEAAGASTAASYVPLVAARVGRGVARWATTGELPPDAPAELASASALGAIEQIGAAVGGAISGLARALFKGTGEGAPRGDAVDGGALASRLGTGRPLDGNTRHRMEGAFGYDLSGVRVHDDGGAASLTRELRARAFTVGQHVAFGRDEFRPGNPAGDALLAHELAHVIQQGSAPAALPASAAPIAVGQPDTLERDADAAAAGAVAALWLPPAERDAGEPDQRKPRELAKRARRGSTRGLRLQRCSSPPVGMAAPPSPAVGTDLQARTRPPTEAQQATIMGPILNPGGAPGTPMTGKGTFVADMTPNLDKWVSDFFPKADKLKKGGAGVVTLDMPHIQTDVAAAAQDAVKDKYGSYITAAGFDPGLPTPARTPAYDLGTALISQESTVDPAALGTGAPFDAERRTRQFVMYAMTLDGYGKSVWDAHNANMGEPVVWGLVTSFATAHQAEIATIVQEWPGEEFSKLNEVSVGLKRLENKKLTKAAGADAVERAGYWDVFQILIHEYLHAAAHGHFMDAAGSDTQGHILREGCADYFREKVWADVTPKIPSDAALREKIEGKVYPYNKAVIIHHNDYPSIASANALVSTMGPAGDANLTAAYFLGHTESLGLAGSPWTKTSASEVGTFVVPAGGLKTTDIVQMTFISEADLIKKNPGLSVGGTVAAGTTLRVPGVTYHTVIAGESDANVATQHGISVAGLHAANPGVTFAPLAPGTKLLIPRH